MPSKWDDSFIPQIKLWINTCKNEKKRRKLLSIFNKLRCLYSPSVLICILSPVILLLLVQSNNRSKETTMISEKLYQILLNTDKNDHKIKKPSSKTEALQIYGITLKKAIILNRKIFTTLNDGKKESTKEVKLEKFRIVHSLLYELIDHLKMIRALPEYTY